MRRILFKSRKSVIAAVFALLIIGPSSYPACAADQNWTGLYVGAHFGYGWGNGDTDVLGLPTASFNLMPQTQSPDPNGVLGGLQVGYNYQTGIFVLGAETDFSLSDMKGIKAVPILLNNGTTYPSGYTMVQQQTDWFGTLRLRAGITPIPQLLLYATGGLAYGDVKYSANINPLPVGSVQYPISLSKTKAGWTAGAGAEYALTRNWSVKAEYVYYDLGDEAGIANPVPANPPYQASYKWKTSANIFRGGLNYKF
ncbi:MAG TPA: outer membrane protein [Dissulfurispiraceae bacterium]|nr:outer membrane protein [Dissulfurispiraceae bacterium]